VAVAPAGTSSISAWRVTFTLPSGHQVTNSWNATLTPSGQNITASNLSWNGTVAPGQQAGWGFQGVRSGSTLPSNFTCSVP
jgi:beta-glucosidase